MPEMFTIYEDFYTQYLTMFKRYVFNLLIPFLLMPATERKSCLYCFSRFITIAQKTVRTDSGSAGFLSNLISLSGSRQETSRLDSLYEVECKQCKRKYLGLYGKASQDMFNAIRKYMKGNPDKYKELMQKFKRFSIEPKSIPKKVVAISMPKLSLLLGPKDYSEINIFLKNRGKFYYLILSMNKGDTYYSLDDIQTCLGDV